MSLETASALEEYLQNLYDNFLQEGAFPEIPDTHPEEIFAHVWRVAKAIRSNSFGDAITALKPLDMESQRIVRNFFSRNVLRDLQKEWTGHGITRTFRFWPHAQKTEYLRFAMRVLDALNQKYEAVLGYGSVLSIIRDNDLIPHDDDLDIVVALPANDIESYKFELERLDSYLSEAGFSVRGDYLAHRHASDGRFMVDVFLGLKEEEFVSWHPGPRKKILIRDVFPHSIATMFGVDCRIPGNSEAYLAAIYGENWRTPIPGWTHDFDPKNYADWFWPKT